MTHRVPIAISDLARRVSNILYPAEQTHSEGYVSVVRIYCCQIRTFCGYVHPFASLQDIFRYRLLHDDQDPLSVHHQSVLSLVIPPYKE